MERFCSSIHVLEFFVIAVRRHIVYFSLKRVRVRTLYSLVLQRQRSSTHQPLADAINANLISHRRPTCPRASPGVTAWHVIEMQYPTRLSFPSAKQAIAVGPDRRWNVMWAVRIWSARSKSEWAHWLATEEGEEEWKHVVTTTWRHVVTIHTHAHTLRNISCTGIGIFGWKTTNKLFWETWEAVNAMKYAKKLKIESICISWCSWWPLWSNGKILNCKI